MSRVRGHYRLPRYIGHRGLADFAPENSLAGLRQAAAAGLTACEIDVQAAADGVAVLMHDFDLGKIADGTIRGYTSEQLSVLQIGTCPDSGEPEYVPTLAAALKLARSLNLQMVVEVKSVRARAQADAEAAAADLRADHGVELMVSSFEPAALAVMAKLMPDMPLALNVEVLPANRIEGYDNIHFDWKRADMQRLTELKQAGLGLYAYTVNSPDVALRLFATGTDGVFTDTTAAVVV